jgi:hypothetical protein
MKIFMAAAVAGIGLAGCVDSARPPEAAPAVPAADFYVAPDGSDAAPGTVKQPFATFAHAQTAVRAKFAAGATTDVRVVFRGGMYPLRQPVMFRPEDSSPAGRRAVYAAWPGETPVFSGGIRIDGFAAGADGAWRTKAPSTLSGNFEQLFVNDRRAVRARHPTAGAFILLDGKEDPKPEERNRSGTSTVTLAIAPGQLAPLAGLDWAALGDVQVVVHHKWDHTRRFLTGANVAAGTVTTRGQQMKPWNPIGKGSLVYFENVPAACDAPGEWFLGRDGTLVYRPRPGETPESAVAWAPRLEKLLVFQGDPAAGKWVDGISLEGLAFLHADSRTPPGGFEPAQAAAGIEAAVMADGARGVILTNCAVAQTGAHAVWFRRGCRECRIDRCRIVDLGGSAIRIGDLHEPSKPAEETWRVTADNNILHHGGRYFPCSVGVWIGHSGTNAVTHNDIADFYYTGISAGWIWGYENSLAKANDIGFNHVHHLGMGWLSDMGGIYTLGRSEGTRVHDNWFHHVWAHTYGGWGLYTDEGSTGIVFENNLVHDTKDGSFHQHYGRENILRNNFLAFSRDCQLRATRVEEHLSFTLENNVILWETGDALKGPFGKIRFESRSNLWWRIPGGGETNFAGKTLAAWQADGKETGSVVADPKCADAARRNFALATDSPAHAVGFKPFPLRAGVYGDPAWIEAARSSPMPDFADLPAWSK